MAITQNPIPDAQTKCHRTGFAKSCRSIVTKGQCRLWMHIIGKHPQSEELLDTWGCADEFVPFLLIENSQMQRQTGAAVESFRNEMVKSNDRMIALTFNGVPRLENK